MEATSPVRLRALIEQDLSQIHRWFQSPELWDHIVGSPHHREENEAVQYMRRWLRPTSAEVRRAIEERSDRRLIGMTTFSPIYDHGARAEFHIFLGEESDRGLGYGKAATVAMLRYGFQNLKLTEINLVVRDSNTAAISLYKKIGFTVRAAGPEGTTSMSINPEKFQFNER